MEKENHKSCGVFKLGLCSLGDLCPLSHSADVNPGMKIHKQNNDNNFSAYDVAANESEHRTISIENLPRPPEAWLKKGICLKRNTEVNRQLPEVNQDAEQVLHFLKSGTISNHEQNAFIQSDIRSRPEIGRISEYGDASPMVKKISAQFQDTDHSNFYASSTEPDLQNNSGDFPKFVTAANVLQNQSNGLGFEQNPVNENLAPNFVDSSPNLESQNLVCSGTFLHYTRANFGVCPQPTDSHDYSAHFQPGSLPNQFQQAEMAAHYQNSFGPVVPQPKGQETLKNFSPMLTSLPQVTFPTVYSQAPLGFGQPNLYVHAGQSQISSSGPSYNIQSPNPIQVWPSTSLHHQGDSHDQNQLISPHLGFQNYRPPAPIMTAYCPYGDECESFQSFNFQGGFQDQKHLPSQVPDNQSSNFEGKQQVIFQGPVSSNSNFHEPRSVQDTSSNQMQDFQSSNFVMTSSTEEGFQAQAMASSSSNSPLFSKMSQRSPTALDEGDRSAVGLKRGSLSFGKQSLVSPTLRRTFKVTQFYCHPCAKNIPFLARGGTCPVCFDNFVEDRSTVDKIDGQAFPRVLSAFDKKSENCQTGGKIDQQSENVESCIASAICKSFDDASKEMWLLEDQRCATYFCHKCKRDVTRIQIGSEIKCLECGDSFLEEKSSADFEDIPNLVEPNRGGKPESYSSALTRDMSLKVFFCHQCRKDSTDLGPKLKCAFCGSVFIEEKIGESFYNEGPILSPVTAETGARSKIRPHTSSSQGCPDLVIPRDVPRPVYPVPESCDGFAWVPPDRLMQSFLSKEDKLKGLAGVNRFSNLIKHNSLKDFPNLVPNKVTEKDGDQKFLFETDTSHLTVNSRRPKPTVAISESETQAAADKNYLSDVEDCTVELGDSDSAESKAEQAQEQPGETVKSGTNNKANKKRARRRQAQKEHKRQEQIMKEERELAKKKEAELKKSGAEKMKEFLDAKKAEKERAAIIARQKLQDQLQAQDQLRAKAESLQTTKPSVPEKKNSKRKGSIKKENVAKSVRSMQKNCGASLSTKFETSSEFSDFSLQDPEVESSINEAQSTFENSNFQDANVKYSRAIDLLTKSCLISEAKKIRLKQKLLTYRAETFLHLEKVVEAEKDATEAIRLNQNVAKTYLIRAKARWRSGKTELAVQDTYKASQLEPSTMNVFS